MDVSGTNLLGAQLMLLRDFLRQQKFKTQPWTTSLVDEIDLKTGQGTAYKSSTTCFSLVFVIRPKQNVQETLF